MFDWIALTVVSVAAAASGTMAVRQVPIEEFVARVAAGDVQCDGPDQTRKRCSSISSFTVQSPTSLTRHERALFDRESNTVVLSDTETYVVNERLCFSITQKQVDAMRFERDGKLLAGAEETAAMQKAQQVYGPYVGVTVCEAIVEINGKFQSAYYYDGVYQKTGPVDAFLLVRPDAGYAVGK